MEIMLIRHGKPAAAINPKLSASGFAKWVKTYNTSLVASHSLPPVMLNNTVGDAYIVSSDLKRAVHSTELCTGYKPVEQHKVFREMDIPRYKLPLKLKAFSWVYFNRFLWTIGLKGPFESFKDARKRAIVAADLLITLAEQNGKVALFSHGYLNVFIRRSLKKKGWQLHYKSNDYWGLSCLSKV